MSENKNDKDADVKQNPKVKKVIKGNLPYTPAPGVFKKTLEGIITAGEPERFTNNFMDTVLGVSGGSSRYVPPLLKKMGFLTSDGVPTQLYTSFRTEGARSSAAFSGLKNAFGELFQRNEYIFKASENDVKDQIVAVTGLTKGDQYVNYIWSTFKVVRDFNAGNNSSEFRDEAGATAKESLEQQDYSARISHGSLGLINNINIVLPESTNINVYNLIFQSLRANLLG
ncbi:DUF5343 domain-containing protein [Hansschlegelia quercus]|uniref:DUF5343 domain-containing protein n=1 Tax=Hansschlegelia quercus TaxID=2528245 RepID=A0A4Q9GE76_9HYPH|nr:DUF5343 domain-containing protein [Hansschlegelia quercus]TBN48643.1 hypothetical protein EYR15_13730 [Hansschlegelia quercus]